MSIFIKDVNGVPLSFAPSIGKSEWYQQIYGGESTLADAIMNRIPYDSYKIDIESANPSKDISMREIYGLEPSQVKWQINGMAL